MKRAALYARVSTNDQDCKRQVRDLTEFAARCGYEIIGVYTETASGTKNDRAVRKQVLNLAQARQIDVILVTELTRWGRSTIDLIETLQQLVAWNVSVVAQTGTTFDLSTPQGKMIAGVMAVLAQFERDTTVERVKSGLAQAKANGKAIGRPKGNRVNHKHGKTVLALVDEGYSYRRIADKLGISKTTVVGIVKEAQPEPV